LKNAGKQGDATLIGQFGVGFYSAFMVADKVQVYTHSWKNEGEHLVWTSDGQSSYTIEEAPDQNRGCKIVLHLKEDAADFCKASTVKQIIEKHSNFVSFPLLLNGERVNTVEALWLKSKDSITDEQYNEFYKFTAHAFDDPSYRMHFQADSPIIINALLFTPTQNMESFGMGQMEPGVSLYCKKVLIDPKPKKLLPEWMRFVRGVIDSEDLPLNISRESMQDSALVRKIGEVVVKRLLKQLDKEASDDATKWNGFYKDFSRFFKEGVATDFTNREAIAKLLRFESSMTQPGETIGLAEYVKRMASEQKAIYYQVAPSRDAIESGPYLEAFKAKGIEVLYMFETIDEYVVSSLNKFDDKDLKAVNADDIDLGDSDADGEALPEAETTSLCDWIKERLTASVDSVRPGKRLVGSPALVLTPEGEMTPQMRQMMKALGKESGMPGPKVIFEINPRHQLVKGLAKLQKSDPDTAGLITEQILDNALLSAGLLDEPQRIIQRTQKLMEKLAS